MKTIIIGFSKHKGFALGSWAIRAFMETTFSHTYFKFKECRFPDSTIFHATGKGLNYISDTKFTTHNDIVAEFKIDISDELFHELLVDCHTNAGTEYGFVQNLGIAAVRYLQKLGINIIKNPIDDGINCSEWIYYILEEVYGKWTETEPNLVAPDEVYAFLISKLPPIQRPPAA